MLPYTSCIMHLGMCFFLIAKSVVRVALAGSIYSFSRAYRCSLFSMSGLQVQNLVSYNRNMVQVSVFRRLLSKLDKL